MSNTPKNWLLVIGIAGSLAIGLATTGILGAVSVATAAPANSHGVIAGHGSHARVSTHRSLTEKGRRLTQQSERARQLRRNAASPKPTELGRTNEPEASKIPAAADPLTTLGAGLPHFTRSDPSGIPMPTGDIPGWSLEFADNFNASEDAPVGSFSGCSWGSTVNASNCTGLPSSDAKHWFAYPDGEPDTTGRGQYEPSQDVSIENGLLNMNLHPNPATGTPGVVALSPKMGGSDGDGQLYGTFAVRFRADTASGYSLAFLLWPDDNVWPEHSEIDFPETDDELGGDATAYMHWMGATSGGQQSIFNSGVSTSSWHTYVIEWTPRAVRFFIDGINIGTATQHLPTDPMHWVLQTSTNLAGVAPVAGESSDIQVAWVAAYSRN